MSDHDKKEIDELSGIETTGHEWDGIKELNNPLPRWWLWTFYATIVWGIGYTIFYPAWPLINSATQGILGYSSRAELHREIERVETERAGLNEALATKDLSEVLADEELRNFAIAGGAAAYRVNCSQCHGTGAQCFPGYPNLNDDNWIWGGTIDELHQTIAYGIRDHANGETRISEMPAFAGVMSRAEIAETAAYVVSLSREPENLDLVEAGAEHYEVFCAACHGVGGEGERLLGAPSLNNPIWLYGGSEAEIAVQVAGPRHGVMPGWADRLGDVTVRKLAVFVHSLGGGE
jgi:cytochrome c oxidase cbb3-type subunit III